MRRSVGCLASLALGFSIGCGDDSGSGPEGSTGQQTTTGMESASTSNADDDDDDDDDDSSTTSSSGDPATSSPSSSDAPTMTDPAPEESSTTDPGETGDGACEYPANPVEPMAVGSVLSPYRWSEAINNDGTVSSVDLANAPCGNDVDIDWSPHEVLLFVSIPAW